MANNAFYGYSPNPTKEADGNRLDKLNPYEFRKGMDYELTNIGCSRLAESSIEDREKATESVLKNLEENGGYYTSLITYETIFRGVDKAPTFKKWLAEQDDNKMQEVDYKFKGDKMEELKETIKSKVRKMILENDDLIDKDIKLDLDGVPTVDSDDNPDLMKNLNQFKNDDSEKVKEAAKDAPDVKGAKGKAKQLKSLEKEEASLGKEKIKCQTAFEKPLAKYKDGKLTSSEYTTQTQEHTDKIKEINSRLKEIEKEKDDINLSEKLGRREVAKSMMEKSTHLEILNIIKEAGVSLNEGSAGIKVHYEIAKTAYQEGFMAGIHKKH
jgi:hypothetical protein